MSVAIVFDLDGTLIDSAPDICGIANTILADLGHPPLSLGEARGFIGNGAAVFVTRMRTARGIPDEAQEALHDRFVALYEDAVSLTLPYPGVPEMLADLRAAGCRLGVCTNKPIRPTRAVLAHLGLDGHFGIVLGGDSLAARKPDPAPLHAAFAGLGGGPQIYVGDSEVDAETAERAGVPFLLFTGGYRKAPVAALRHAVHFDDHADLPALIHRLAAEIA